MIFEYTWEQSISSWKTEIKTVLKEVNKSFRFDNIHSCTRLAIDSF